MLTGGLDLKNPEALEEFSIGNSHRTARALRPCLLSRPPTTPVTPKAFLNRPEVVWREGDGND